MGTARIRRNSFLIDFTAHQRLLNSSGVVQSDAEKYLKLHNYEYCADELNEMALMGQGRYDIGGNFVSSKAKHKFPIATQYAAGYAFGLTYECDGPIVAFPRVAITGGETESVWRGKAEAGLDSPLVRVSKGATAISRCKPATPEASLAVALAETFREGIPSTLRQFTHMKDTVAEFRHLSKSQKGKEAPSKYLEYQFGWKPLVADIRSASQALLNYEKILEDLRRNSGRRMRRRYQFPTETSTAEIYRDATRPWPNPNLYILSQAGQFVVTESHTKKTWFAGEFVYTYPSYKASIPSQMIAGARHLLGLDLTPETIWNIAPWTWLSDWFANVGDVVSNFTAIGADHLILRYGYLMQEATLDYRHTHSGLSVASGYIPSTLSGTTSYTTKSRIVATPYGFGLTMDSLTPRQIAILTSIGITRRGRH